MRRNNLYMLDNSAGMSCFVFAPNKKDARTLAVQGIDYYERVPGEINFTDKDKLRIVRINPNQYGIIGWSRY